MPSRNRNRNKMQLMISVCNLVVLCIGIILVILGLTSLTCFSILHENIISSALKMGPKTEAFKAWQKPKTPITMDIYFYNWTNPEDIYNTSIKPKFVEMGPYRFKQFKEKTNITWNPGNKTITYQYLKHFYFVKENSTRLDTDVVTTLNMVALSAAHMANDWNIILKQAVKMSLFSSKIYIQKTVRELLFEGYEDPILATASMIPFISEDKVDRFGWFHGRNGSIGGDGIYNMGTSPDNNFGTLKRWNYENRTPFYKDSCADITGSGGELYPRNVKPTTIKFFSPEMCRTVQFNFEKNVNVKGVPGYKFAPGAEVFDNGTDVKENICYCNGKCLPSGVLNVSACRQDAPVYLSLPHFYQADSTYVEAVEGLRPIKDKHELYLTLEPNTGVIADISARMQVNALLQPIPDFTLFEEAPRIMFPVFWFEQKVVMSDELASGLGLLFSLPDIVDLVSISVMIIGLLCIISVVLYVSIYKQRKYRGRVLTKEEIPLKTKS